MDCYPCFTGVPHLQNITTKLLVKNTYIGKKEIKLICSAITFHPMQGIIIWKNLYREEYPISPHIFYINRHNALFLLSDSFYPAIQNSTKNLQMYCYATLASLDIEYIYRVE